MTEKIIPPQQKGASTDITAQRKCNNENDAKEFFKIARQRIMDVNNWEKLAGFASANFYLCDEAGNEVERTVMKGDHFKIDVPGPGPVAGDGYDWVKVEEVKDLSDASSELVAIKVRPVPSPLNSNNDVAHFFDDSATSTFLVKREGLEVVAEIHGRNEVPNSNLDNVIDKVRNTTMATAAVAGISKLQWKSLAEGIVRET